VSKPEARVLITAEEASPLDELLRSRGMVPVHRPLSRTIVLHDPPPCALPGAVILSSARAARLAPALQSWVGAAPVACVGEATAQAARLRGLRPWHVGEAGASAILSALEGAPVPWVFVGARAPAPAMRQAIERGEVLPWAVYDQEEQVLDELPEVELVLLASPSAARTWARSGGGHLPVVVIGQTTASEAEACGLRIVGQAARPGWSELAQAAAEVLQPRKNGPAS